jgi:hypothetical protein
MAVAPAIPYPPGAKPPPAMTYGQFRSAVRLIQLFQNGVTAFDEGLNAIGAGGGGGKDDGSATEQRAMLSPPHFEGVSGMAVPLPLSSRSANGGASIAPTTRDRLSKSMTAAKSGGPEIGGGGGGRGAPTRMPTHDSSSSGGGSTRSHRTDQPNRRQSADSSGSFGSKGIDEPMRRATTDSRGSAGSNGIGQPTWTSKSNSIAREKARVAMPSGDYVVDPRPKDHRYSMSRNDRIGYRETFARHCVADGSGRRHVYVDAAVAYFERSGLTREVIGGLWDVVARDPNGGKLDRREFAIMVHLLVCATRRGIALPDVLPTPLRIWRDGKGLNDDDDDDDDDYSSVVDVMKGGGIIVEGGDRFNRQHSDNSRDEEERLKRMEREILSLKGLVASLRIEVRDLRDSLGNKGNAKFGNISNGVPAKMRFSNSSSDAAFLSGSDRTEGYENGALRESLISDAPTVDVEMYWGDGKGDSKESVRTTVIQTERSNKPLTLRMQPAEGLPSSLRNGGKMNSKTKRIVPGISQNIPPIHPPSTGSRASRRSTKQLDHGAPQSRNGNAIPAASDNATGMRKSILYTPTENLATQMQRVQQVTTFDTLIQTAIEKITTGDTGSKNSGSKGRVSPPQQRRRRRLTADNRNQSFRHIRRGLGGETEVYHELDVIEKSTKALDLQPL